MNIIALKQYISGVTFNRLYQPLLSLQAKYPDVNVKFITIDGLEATDNADIFFLCSPTGWFQKDLIGFLKKYNASGLKIVLDFDDGMEEVIPASNPAYAQTGIKECKYNVGKNLTMAWEDKKTQVDLGWTTYTFNIKENKKYRKDNNDIRKTGNAFIVTTKKLKEHYSKYGIKTKVIPNAINPALYTKLENKTNEVRLGWVIGGSHLKDYLNMVDTLNDALEKYPNLKLVIMSNGTTPMEFFDKKRVEYYTGTAIMNGYHDFFSELKLDIGLAHLENNDFNKLKSPLKWLEYTAVGIPTIASNVLYDDYITDNETGVLYNSKKDFIKKLDKLMDKKYRDNIAEKSKLAVEQFNVDTVADKYYNFFKEVIQ